MTNKLCEKTNIISAKGSNFTIKGDDLPKENPPFWAGFLENYAFRIRSIT